MKAGGSLTLRSREILNADTIVGHFDFNKNMTSNCAGHHQPAAPSTATPASTSPASCSATRARKTAICSTRAPTPRSGPSTPPTSRTTSASTQAHAERSACAGTCTCRGSRSDDRQSNFDVSTGRFVVASDDAVDQRRQGRPLPADLLEARLRAALRLRLRSERRRQDHRPRRLRHLLELHARRHLVVEGAEPAVPAVDVADADADRATAATCCSRTACRRLPASIRTGPPRARPGRSSTSTSATRTRAMEHQRAARLGTNYMVEVAYVGSQGRAHAASRAIRTRRRRSSASPTRTSTGPTPRCRRRCGRSARCRATGTLDYNGLLVKFQRRFANNFSFLNSYTYGKAIDLNSDNDGTVTLTNVYDPDYNRGPADYDITHTFVVELDLRAAVGAQQAVWRLAGERHPAAARRPAADGHADPGRAVHRHRQPPEPRLRRHVCRTRPSITGSTPPASCRRPTSTGTYGDAGRGIIRGPGSFNIDASLIKNTKIGRYTTEFRVEAFNLLNHPQFANPNTQIGNAAVRHDLGDAVEPVVLAVRHHRATGPAGREGCGSSEMRPLRSGLSVCHRFHVVRVFA